MSKASLHRIFELKEETAIFLSDSNNNDDANLCHSEDGLFDTYFFKD
jgi:hypothetical protein